MIFLRPLALSPARPFPLSLTFVLLLIAALLAARCDDLAEPVAITPEALRPTIVTNLSATVNEDGSFTLDVEADDPNGEALTLTLTTPPLHGTAVLVTNTAQARTGRAPSPEPAVVAPETPSEAEPPQQESAREKSIETDAETALRRPTPNPVDIPKNTQTDASTGIHASAQVIRGSERPAATAGTAVVGRIRYTPEADFNGTDRFGFLVRNMSGYTSEAEVIVRIDAEPDAPTVVRPLDDLTLAPGQRITLNIRTENVFADTDGDALVYQAQSRDETVATAELAGDEVLTVQALNAPNQATLIDVTATDPVGLSVTASFTVTVEASDNRPPRVENPIPDRAIIVGETFTIPLKTVFTDDDGDELTFTAASGNPPVAQVEIVPPDTLRVSMLSTGIATITITATDGLATAQTTFLVFLNPGVNAVDDAAETDADVPVVIDVLENDRDSNNGPLTVAGILQFPDNGSVEIIDSGQRIRYTPNPFFFGEDFFTYVASNEQGDLDQAAVTVMVREVNRPPEITALVGTTEGFVDDTYTFSATAIDPNDGDVLTYTWDFGDGSELLSGEAVTTVNHVYTTAGTFTLTLTVNDLDGAVDMETLAVVVTVPPETDPEAIDDLYRLTEGGTLVVDAGDGVLANDRDPKGNGLTAMLLSNVVHGTLTFNADGSFIYVHDGSETTDDTFRYRASDGVAETNEATVRLLVSALNDPPVAVDDSYTTDQNVTLTVAPTEGVLLNDTDVDGDDDDLVAVLTTSTTNGSLTLNATGSFTYTPNTGFFGSDSFTYRASDGEDQSNEATVSIRVNQAGNTLPEVTNPGSQDTVENQLITPLPIVATDPDTPLRYTTATLPPGLSLDASTGLITGFPALDAAGPTGTRTYAVTVFVTDARGGQSSVTFNWTITNPSPTVDPVSDQNNDEDETITPLQIQAFDDDPLLSYHDAGTLPPGVSIETTTGLISGTLAGDAAGPTGSTTYAVIITVSDGQGGNKATAFNWTVTNPDPVVTNPGEQNNTEGDAPTLQILATDDDDALSYAASNLPGGLLIDPNKGLTSGAISNAAAGPAGQTTYTVSVTVSDVQMGATAVQFGWTVINPQPIVNNPGDQTSSEGESVLLQIQASDDDMVTYAATGLPDGLAIDANTGEISGTVAMSASSGSPYTVDITVTDGQLGVGTVQFTWTVTNPPPVVTNPGNQNNLEGETPSLQIVATDPDLPLTYAATGLPTGLTLDAGTGLIDGVIADDATGATGTTTFTVDVTVTDSQGASAAVQFDWAVTNPAPVVTDPGDQNNIGGETVSLQIQATDDDPVTYAATGLPPGLDIDVNTGEISGTIALDAGNATPYTVDVIVTDNQTGSTAVQFDWSVDNPQPTLSSLTPPTAAQGTTLDVTLTGSNFIDGVSSVAFSGTGITLNTTTVNSNTEIVVNVTLDATAPTGDRDVTVTNTGPGGGTSGAQTFTVTM